MSEIKSLTELKQYLTTKAREVEAAEKGADYLASSNLYVYFKDQVEQLDECMKAVKALKDKLAQFIIPSQMDAAQVKTFTLQDGTRISRTVRVMASIPSEVKLEAFAYLKANGLAGIVTETVNAQTLSAVVKEKMEAGFEFPDTMFKVHTADNVSVTKSKK